MPRPSCGIARPSLRSRVGMGELSVGVAMAPAYDRRGGPGQGAATSVPYPAGVRDSQWKPTSLRWNIILPWPLIAAAGLTVVTGRLPREHLVGLADTSAAGRVSAI